MTTDLDFDTDGDFTIDDSDAFWNGGAGWEPIGTDGARFTTTFEGNDHTISNLFINRGNMDDVGLFGVSENNAIRNLGLVNVDVTGSRSVGALVGISVSTIQNVYMMGEISGNDIDIGGLVGRSYGPITASYALGAVSGDSSSHVGGLVGRNDGPITTSYALGTVSGHGSVGGLVGARNSGSITASYAVGTVSGNSLVGGLVGLQNDGPIIASYAVGTVSGNTDVGGLVGRSRGDITASYFDSDVVELSEPSDADQGKMTTELQTPTTITGSVLYSDWNVDIDDDGEMDAPWHFGNDMQYPGLALGATDAPCSEATHHVGFGADFSAWGVQTRKRVDGQCVHRPIYVTIQDFGPAAADDLGTYSTDRITSTATVSLRGKVVPANSTVRIAALTVPDELTVPSRGAADTGDNGAFETTARVTLEEGPNRFSGYATVTGVAEMVGPIVLPEIIRDTQPPRLILAKTTPSDNCASVTGCAVTIRGTDNVDAMVTIRYIRNFSGDETVCETVMYAEVVADMTAYPIYDSATPESIRIAAGMPQCFIATDQAGNLFSRFSEDIVSALRLRLKILLEGALQ